MRRNLSLLGTLPDISSLFSSASPASAVPTAEELCTMHKNLVVILKLKREGISTCRRYNLQWANQQNWALKPVFDNCCH